MLQCERFRMIDGNKIRAFRLGPANSMLQDCSAGMQASIDAAGAGSFMSVSNRAPWRMAAAVRLIAVQIDACRSRKRR
jgi:hypothetical protein